MIKCRPYGHVKTISLLYILKLGSKAFYIPKDGCCQTAIPYAEASRDYVPGQRERSGVPTGGNALESDQIVLFKIFA